MLLSFIKRTLLKGNIFKEYCDQINKLRNDALAQRSIDPATLIDQIATNYDFMQNVSISSETFVSQLINNYALVLNESIDSTTFIDRIVNLCETILIQRDLDSAKFVLKELRLFSLTNLGLLNNKSYYSFADLAVEKNDPEFLKQLLDFIFSSTRNEVKGYFVAIMYPHLYQTINQITDINERRKFIKCFPIESFENLDQLPADIINQDLRLMKSINSANYYTKLGPIANKLTLAQENQHYAPKTKKKKSSAIGRSASQNKKNINLQAHQPKEPHSIETVVPPSQITPNQIIITDSCEEGYSLLQSNSNIDNTQEQLFNNLEEQDTNLNQLDYDQLLNLDLEEQYFNQLMQAPDTEEMDHYYKIFTKEAEHSNDVEEIHSSQPYLGSNETQHFLPQSDISSNKSIRRYENQLLLAEQRIEKLESQATQMQESLIQCNYLQQELKNRILHDQEEIDALSKTIAALQRKVKNDERSFLAINNKITGLANDLQNIHTRLNSEKDALQNLKNQNALNRENADQIVNHAESLGINDSTIENNNWRSKVINSPIESTGNTHRAENVNKRQANESWKSLISTKTQKTTSFTLTP